jgi:glycerol uptake operon antiterminator
MMMKVKSESFDRLAYCLKRKPVITSLVNKEELPSILQSTSNIVFVLKSDIFSIEPIVEQIREAGKLSFIHFDLIDGIGKDKMGVTYMAEKIGIDGIVTTKSSIITEGKKHGLMTIQRLSQPDAIEVLPGMVCSRIMQRIRDEVDVPVIAGGLMVDLSDLEAALKSGAIGISTSSKELWKWQDANA